MAMKNVLVLIFLLCILLITAADMSGAQNDNGLRETPVEDPIGLGERLALIDYLRDHKKIAIKAGSSLADLRRIYWQLEITNSNTLNAQERDRIRRLRRSLENTYNIQINKDIDWQDLQTLKTLHENKKEKELQEIFARQQEKDKAESYAENNAGNNARNSLTTRTQKKQSLGLKNSNRRWFLLPPRPPQDRDSLFIIADF